MRDSVIGGPAITMVYCTLYYGKLALKIKTDCDDLTFNVLIYLFKYI